MLRLVKVMPRPQPIKLEARIKFAIFAAFAAFLK